MICLSTMVRAEAFTSIGIDTISSAFFRNWYQTTDLSHYLDNCNDYVVYESETTGEWNLGDRNIFSIAGNSFRQTKYRLNGMRIDSRTQPGNTLLHTQMDRTALTLDYHDGELSFQDDYFQRRQLRLTGNVGNLAVGGRRAFLFRSLPVPMPVGFVHGAYVVEVYAVFAFGGL